MNCINCGKPFNGGGTPVFSGLFPICHSCSSTGKVLDGILTRGVEIEIFDPKTKSVVKQTLKN